jgi:hypothetical protein
MTHVLLTEPTQVVGFPYVGADPQAIAGHVQLGSFLDARFDPDNVYDTNAIEVFLQGRRLGYIDAGCASRVADLQIDHAELSIQIVTTGLASRHRGGILKVRLTCSRLPGDPQQPLHLTVPMLMVRHICQGLC